MITEKEVNNLVEGYENYTGIGVEAHKTSGAPDTNLSKSDLEDPQYINNYRSFMGCSIPCSFDTR